MGAISLQKMQHHQNDVASFPVMSIRNSISTLTCQKRETSVFSIDMHNKYQ